MNDNALEIRLSAELVKQFEREAKALSFISTEAYILHLLEQERLKGEAARKDVP